MRTVAELLDGRARRGPDLEGLRRGIVPAYLAKPRLSPVALAGELAPIVAGARRDGRETVAAGGGAIRWDWRARPAGGAWSAAFNAGPARPQAQ